ncbi:MAG: hypothetical protein HOP02_05805 [Methylococcaceae bacterium]|nr:hypothetical protein [Methylococcaceae bacterium]
MNKSFAPEHAVFIAQMLLALCGAYLTNYIEAASHFYWLIMLLLSALVTLIPDFAQMQANEPQAKQRFYTHVQYWVGSLFAAMIVYALHEDGRIDIHETGLIILLILALSTYFDGVVKASKRTMFTGFYLGLIVLSTAFPETYLLQLFLLAVGVVAFSHYVQMARSPKIVQTT